MASLRICLLSFFLLAGLRVAGASASDSFKECRQFLYMRTPPAGIQGTNMKRICQRYGDKPRYVTLYDSSRRCLCIQPTPSNNQMGRGGWTRPGCMNHRSEKEFVLLATVEDSPNMQILPPSGKLDPLLEESQALLEDYVDAAAYERGALNPDQHQAESQDKAATYTLTNVVPQIIDFTKGSWEAYIDRVRRRLNNFCRGVAYMVTGVTISGVTIRRGGQDRLAVPKHLWSAYCCPRYERNSPYEVRYMFPSYGAYGLNDMMDHDVVEVPLRTLENFLQSQTGTDRNVSIFLKGCISENTFKRKKRSELCVSLLRGDAFLLLSALLLLSCFTSPVRPSVDDSSGEYICQRYVGEPSYAALYDPALPT
ncbi:hypothetical protein P4O66_008588 [Electrophorus voltai]|uniref:Endonuclease domain-containing 1 protein-like n=1 Tax=Electrophorus voltai TaxID=2609070 RepID=A0AAD8ZEY6_9TELE|nr:hypothetical protein P4O66_008588 [Electrophorus voltai]